MVRNDVRLPDEEETIILEQYGLSPANWYVQWTNTKEVHFVSTRGRGKTISKTKAAWERKYENANNSKR